MAFAISLFIIGFLLAAMFVISRKTYNLAIKHGRSPAWILAVIAAGFAGLFVVPIIVSFIIAAILMLSGSDQFEISDTVQKYSVLIAIFGLIVGFLGMFLVLKHVGSTPKQIDAADAPMPVLQEFDDRD